MKVCVVYYADKRRSQYRLVYPTDDIKGKTLVQTKYQRQQEPGGRKRLFGAASARRWR